MRWREKTKLFPEHVAYSLELDLLLNNNPIYSCDVEVKIGGYSNDDLRYHLSNVDLYLYLSHTHARTHASTAEDATMTRLGSTLSPSPHEKKPPPTWEGKPATFSSAKNIKNCFRKCFIIHVRTHRNGKSKNTLSWYILSWVGLFHHFFALYSGVKCKILISYSSHFLLYTQGVSG